MIVQLLGANVSGLVGFGNAVPFPLGWGEVIPLHFIAPYLPSTSKLMVLSQPERRYADSVSMIPELLKLGTLNFNCASMYCNSGDLYPNRNITLLDLIIELGIKPMIHTIKFDYTTLWL